MSSSPFFDQIAKAREVVQASVDAPRSVALALELVEDPDVAREFFKMLNSAEWLIPLRDARVFTSPPSRYTSSDGATKCAAWPQSQYLARVAAMAPLEVADVFRGLETDNVTIVRDMLDATRKMPPSVAATLGPQVCAAYKRNALWIAFADAAELCARLASEGEADAAMGLVECLFQIDEHRRRERSSRVEDQSYAEAIGKVIPAIVGTRSKQFLTFLLDGLRVLADDRAKGGDDPEYDRSVWWRPAIEEHEQNSDYDFACVFVGCVREALETAIGGGHLSFDDALGLLGEYRRLVFRRLALHLVNTCADLAPDRARQAILSQALLDDYRYKHEYAMLCERRFSLLSDEDKAAWLGWVDKGPDVAEHRRYVLEDSGREPTATEIADWVVSWRMGKLCWIREHLVGERREQLERMLAERGVPELVDLNVKSGALWSGEESPFQLAEISKKEFAEVVEFLRTWRPKERDPLGRSIEGAAGTFRQYLEQDPVAYSVHAALLKALQPIYVRTFIGVMTEAIRNGSKVSLGPVLELCQWIIAQPVSIAMADASVRSPLIDTNWQWTRSSVGELVREVCEQGTPLQSRPWLWSLIEPLTNDPGEADVGESADRDPRTSDFSLTLLNSPCGKAMHALFAYARWVVSGGKGKSGKLDSPTDGFAQLPEVRALLERRLTPDDPGGFSLRAAVGWHWTLLYVIDKKWLAQHAARICDIESSATDLTRAYGWAAWNSFLTSADPHIEHYRLLKSQFSYAVDQAASIAVEDDVKDGPFHRLGEHLVLLRARGQLPLDADNGIVERFLTKAAVPFRTHAMEFVGVTLWRERPKLKTDFEKRLTDLWDWYWERIGRVDAESNPRSRAFAFWFASTVFDEKWSLARLERFVRVVPKPEPDDQIVERLKVIAPADLGSAVRILGHLVDGDDENWRIHGWKEQAKEILTAAMKIEGEPRDEAVRVIDRLGRRGFLEFGELLP
ncbi:MAG: hypothetical protein HYS13_23115 [Planctomycetia bacterium]|nr:hypothetical protein [Planctomycetia bacterium]